MSNDGLYNIEKILARRKAAGGKYEYKIKWEGYPINQSTWEPMKNLMTAKELVDEYDRLHPIPTPSKKNGTENKKKVGSLLNKKRKEDENDKNEGQNQSNSHIENNNQEKEAQIKKDEGEEEKKNTKENAYIIDDSLKSVLNVKQQDDKLLALVEILDTNGEMNKVYIPTQELRKTNPWILLNFYESKIKFS